MKVITVSYTPLDAPGGVPRFNRDIHSSFPGSVHYSWWDVAAAMGVDPNSQNLPEWEKARVLSSWLLKTGKVTESDVVIADSFWADGLHHLPYCISHQHGNWSHTTFADVLNGVQPEFPMHAAAQLDFRRRYVKAGRKLTAVSAFIAHQMHMQWGFEATVINNGIDLHLFHSAILKNPRQRPLFIHFVTNQNKGFEHIEAVKKAFDADVLLLDAAAQYLQLPKYEALAQADLVIHPSAHEGNSYAVLETLACEVPIVAYNVGLLYEVDLNDRCELVGAIGDRLLRSPDFTVNLVREALENLNSYDPRYIAQEHDVVRFRTEWQEYVNDLVQSR